MLPAVNALANRKALMTHMRATLATLALITACAGCASDNSQGGTKSHETSGSGQKEAMTTEDAPMPPPANLRMIMQSKTAWAAALLESVASRDYARIETNAEALGSLSADSGFLAQDTLSYRTLAVEFRQEVSLLAAAAQRRDQADVETAYHRVTSACFRCHEYVGSERYRSSMPGRAGM
jgi:cytochrome c553